MVSLKSKAKKQFEKEEKQFRRFDPAPLLTTEQSLLQEMFGSGEQTWGTGRDLPKIEGRLTSGYGILNTGSSGETGRMFGI